MSRGVDLNPANHARRAAVAARAFAFRHRTPIAVVFGGAATIATWHSSLYAIDFFARGAPRDPAVELATLGLSITFVTLGSRSLRRRAFADPDVVHAAIVRRVENHAGLREVLGAPVRERRRASSPRRRAASGSGEDATSSPVGLVGARTKSTSRSHSWARKKPGW